LVLTDNGADPLDVSASGSFVFESKVNSGDPFSVQVKSQPVQPSQTCVVANGGGTAGATDMTDVAVRCTTNPPTLRLLAGNVYGHGPVDGTGAAALFGFLFGVVVDPVGNIYVADNAVGIRKVSATGVVTKFVDLSAVSGNYSQGMFTIGQLALDVLGNLYVAATSDDTIRKVTPAGEVTTLAGASGAFGSADGNGTAARFAGPQGVAVDAAGNLYVADTGNNAIRKITPAGVVTTLAGGPTYGGADGVGPAAQFNEPAGLATDAAGNVYVADTGNSTIRKITPGGVVTTIAGGIGMCGVADGVGSAARFCTPNGIARDSVGNFYVADSGGNTIRRMTPGGNVTTVAGDPLVPGIADGTGSSARFDLPLGVAPDAAGNIYVTDTDNTTLRRISSSGVVTTLAGSKYVPTSKDGVGAAAEFEYPQGLATDAQSNVYVADSEADTIRKITPAGVVTTLAGLSGMAGEQDGTGSAARFDTPNAIAADATGNLYVLDRAAIRKIMRLGIVTTFATGAGFPNTDALTIDGAGNIDVLFEDGPLVACLVWQYTPAGAPTLRACEWMQLPPPFDQLGGIATDAQGNVYVSDFGNHIISKIVPSGAVTTLAGQAQMSGSRDGAGTDAQFEGPSALTIDHEGNLYAIDASVIRKITPAGVVTTIAGVSDRVGFKPGPLPGILNGGSGIAISGTSLYVSMAQGVAVIENVP
jgi:sugar lactone lactonase YvrE